MANNDTQSGQPVNADGQCDRDIAVAMSMPLIEVRKIMRGLSRQNDIMNAHPRHDAPVINKAYKHQKYEDFEGTEYLDNTMPSREPSGLSTSAAQYCVDG